MNWFYLVVGVFLAVFFSICQIFYEFAVTGCIPIPSTKVDINACGNAGYLIALGYITIIIIFCYAVFRSTRSILNSSSSKIPGKDPANLDKK